MTTTTHRAPPRFRPHGIGAAASNPDRFHLTRTDGAVPCIKNTPSFDLSRMSSKTSFSTRIVTSPGWTLYCSAAHTRNAADNAEPFNDGQSNLPEHALNPTLKSARRSPAHVQVMGGSMEYRYTRSTAAVSSGKSFQVQWSDDQATWATAGVVQTMLSDDGTTQQMKATLPAGNTRRFVRLMVQ